MEFLTPFRTGSSLNSVERQKLARHPLDVYRSVIETYAPLGKDATKAIAAVEGETERLKWVGIYPQRQGGDAYMMRFKIPGGRLSAAGARMLGRLADRHGRGPEPDSTWGAGYCDITTRQDVQLHWVAMGDVPAIWDSLSQVGLGTLQACGDSARNVLCCPVSGVDAMERVDAFSVAEAISSYFTGNREYANLPRKFKISVTGCVEDCVQAEINDIGLLPAIGPAGVVGFNLLVGGGLSDGPRMASDVDVWISSDQAVELCRSIAQVFGELGNRENRGVCRMRYLVQELGPERFRAEVAERCAFEPSPAGEALTTGYRRDHIGVHPQRQAGLNYVGLNVTVGRIAGVDLAGMADLAEQYGDSTLRLSTHQDLILTGVRDDRVADLLDEPLLERYSPAPGPFARGAVACTGNEFCRFAIVETKARMVSWAQRMDHELRSMERQLGATSPETGPAAAGRAATGSSATPTVAAGAQGGEVIRMHLSGCSASCAQPQIADIGFRGETAIRHEQIVEAVDVGLGGSLGPEAGFIDWVEGAMPAEDVLAGLVRVVARYRAERRASEEFYQWSRRTPNEVLRGLLAGAASPPQTRST